jgi:hypothetical protein
MKLSKDTADYVDKLIGTALGATRSDVIQSIFDDAIANMKMGTAERMQKAAQSKWGTLGPPPSHRDANTASIDALVDASLKSDPLTEELVGDWLEDETPAWTAAVNRLDAEFDFLANSPMHYVEVNLQQVPAMCVVCGLQQFETRSGVTCFDGHGGADSVPLEDVPEDRAVTRTEALALTGSRPLSDANLPAASGDQKIMPAEPTTSVRSILTAEQIQRKPYIDAAIADGLLTHAVVAQAGTSGAWQKLLTIAPEGWFKKFDAAKAATPTVLRTTLCPFHPDTNASLALYSDGSFHCRSCKKIGKASDDPKVTAAFGEHTPEIDMGAVVGELDRLGYHITLPIFMTLDPKERTKIGAWLKLGAEQKTIPRVLLAEIERGELLPPCPKCKSNKNVRSIGGKASKSYQCAPCNIAFEPLGPFGPPAPGPCPTGPTGPADGPIGAGGCAACDQGKPFTNGTEYLHTGTGILCSTPTGANGAANGAPLEGGAGRKGRTCKNCDEAGHDSRNCTKPKREATPAEGKKERTCGKCGGVGHNARSCGKPSADPAASKLDPWSPQAQESWERAAQRCAMEVAS